MKLRHSLCSIILLLTTICLLLSLPAYAADTAVGLSNFRPDLTYKDGMFADVSKNDWFYQNVAQAYEYGLMQGTGSGFVPTGNISIVETIVTACRLHNIYNGGGHVFKATTPWEKPYIDYAVKHGLIGANDYSNYSAKATRAQFAEILANALPKEALPAINDIRIGFIYDVPVLLENAEDIYLLYNAGILKGSDAYGTFSPDKQITRAEVAAIITRMANPELRMEFSLSMYDPIPPESIVITDCEVSYSSKKTVLSVGQTTQMDVEMKPLGAHSGIEWTSTDPTVASVDQWGKVHAHDGGTVTLTAKTYNGVTDTFIVEVNEYVDPLTYQKTADGKGCRITDCKKDVYLVNIPAEYEGLPVTEIDGEAFIGCENLGYFTVDSDHSIFYEEDGVIFSDQPQKTLVRFPNKYMMSNAYFIPADTIHIAPYAFAGLEHSALFSITIPEGVQSLGSYAFSYLKSWILKIVVPDSLVNIGKYITKYAEASLPFYVKSGQSIFAQYANDNQIPCGIIIKNNYGNGTLTSSVPKHLSADQMIEYVGTIQYVPSEIAQAYGSYHWHNSDLYRMSYDFTDMQSEFSGEIRWNVHEGWCNLIPDINGNTEFNFPAMTGVYGAGYTKGNATLRGYDIYGNLIAMQYINGDFAFAFPGAYSIGIENGTNTAITILPIEPVYIQSSGDYEINPDTWYSQPDGDIQQHFIVCMPYASVKHIFSDERITVGGQTFDSVTQEFEDDLSSHYQIVNLDSSNHAYIEKLKGSLLQFETKQTVYETNDFSLLKNSQIILPDQYGESAAQLWSDVKDFMCNTYFPEISDDYKLYLLANDQYPTCSENVINIDHYVYESFEAGRSTLIHEMIHAVDHSIEQNIGGYLTPSSWMEGRAEYIGEKMMDAYGYEYYGYEETFDWSFISEDEKQDFFHYYYFSTNRYTAYNVGYYFCKYLCETYGEDIMMHISKNLEEITDYDHNSQKDRNAQIFKSCITSVTDENVFQNFVRDVIEQ